jgi:methyl acetate hydrolase
MNNIGPAVLRDDMNKLESVLRGAVDSGRVPFLIGAAAYSGHSQWTGCATLPSRPEISVSSVLRVVSMSKAVGVTAALILEERGLLDWRVRVEDIVPSFSELGVIEEAADGGLRIREMRTKATLKHLAMHTCGLGYDCWSERLALYHRDHAIPPVHSGKLAALRSPLLEEPGERWRYGLGIDWLGLVIEALSGETIDQFCRKEIFEPLGIESTGFTLSSAMTERLVPVFVRDEEGGFQEAPFNLDPPRNPEFFGLGYGLYSTASDYLRFLQMWLNEGILNGTRILESSSISRSLQKDGVIPPVGVERSVMPALVGDLNLLPGAIQSQVLPFMQVDHDLTNRRRAGSCFWAGLLNTHFWFDPKSGIAGILMTQLVPFLDPIFMEVYSDFEQAVYLDRNVASKVAQPS